jgi:predicted Zn-dependent protease with MMP-like domain
MDDLETFIDEALDSLPPALREQLSNVEITIDDEPPADDPDLLGLYEGVPLTERGMSYGGVLPDKVTIFRGPLVRAYGRDRERLRAETMRTVLHELAHHFGIDDDRLVDLDRY